MVVRVELGGVYARGYRLYRRVVRSPTRHLPEPAGVPELVAEVAPQLHALFAKQYVLPLRRAVHDAEAQSVRPVAGDYVEGIGGVAEAL